LNLKDEKGKLISHNVYWFAKDHQYQALKELPTAKLNTKIIQKVNDQKNTKWTIQFTNNTKKIAFFVHPKITSNNEELFPGFWTGNYFTLAPGESIILDAAYPKATIANKQLQLRLSGWDREELVQNLD
jgi:hypothetical protein